MGRQFVEDTEVNVGSRQWWRAPLIPAKRKKGGQCRTSKSGGQSNPLCVMRVMGLSMTNQCFRLEKETHTSTHTERHTYSCIQAHMQTKTKTHPETQTHTHRHTDRNTHTHSHRMILSSLDRRSETDRKRGKLRRLQKAEALLKLWNVIIEPDLQK